MVSWDTICARYSSFFFIWVFWLWAPKCSEDSSLWFSVYNIIQRSVLKMDSAQQMLILFSTAHRWWQCRMTVKVVATSIRNSAAASTERTNLQLTGVSDCAWRHASLHMECLFFVMKTAYFDPASSKHCETAWASDSSQSSTHLFSVTYTKRPFGHSITRWETFCRQNAPPCHVFVNGMLQWQNSGILKPETTLF